MSLVPLDGLLAGTAGACASEIVAAMYNHDSLVPLGNRLLCNKAFVRYAREDYACKRGRSPEWLVSFVIFNYLEFMAVLADNRTDNAYRRFLPPPVVDVVWHEHLLDTFGYPAFCIDVVGGNSEKWVEPLCVRAIAEGVAPGVFTSLLCRDTALSGLCLLC
ncbi:hypothetical protein CYMTET_38634 [Cymbomonas tetramitiformis]|uniref:Uncharacterized protein n=1 Tax=Cymbomonas tetramitiformis TaxID=36881 RepID=A0AAE0CBN3_9CHLO|nr:hypothetical protein CYMTET_38634 [Cymbomonas tetramitiformis]